MAYFHSKWPRPVGGRKGRPMIRVVAETIGELRELKQAYPQITTLSLPPSGIDCWKSKSLPVLRIDADQKDVLEEIGSVEVSEDHVRLLTWFLRRDWYVRRSGVGIGDREKWFETEIRANLCRLLRAGEWVDEPESLSLQNLNQRLEKIDLGRRSDLKFSSVQSGDTKYQSDRYNPLFRKHNPPPVVMEQTQMEEDLDISDNEREYRNADPEERQRILASKPWLGFLATKYP